MVSSDPERCVKSADGFAPVNPTEDWISTILSRIKFAPSCVDMGWKWEVATVRDDSGLELERGGGFLIRTTFQRPDRDTGEIDRGFGRWWHVPDSVSESGVVKTAFAAAKMILEHELMESFRYRGQRLFDPHHEVEDLSVACSYHIERTSR